MTTREKEAEPARATFTKPRYLRIVRPEPELTPALKALADAVTALTRGNDRLAAYLAGGTTASERVANAPEIGLVGATKQAKEYWDKLEGKRSSSAPPPSR